MKIWADADSLPPGVRALIARRASSLATRGDDVEAVFVANRPMKTVEGRGVRFILAGKESGAADDSIAAQASAGDIAVTRDIPLAGRLLELGIAVINHKGELFTVDRIRERISIRDAMLELRLSGLAESGPSSFGPRELKSFADGLDRALAKRAGKAGAGFTICHDHGISLT
jgi:uncharacterized protein YaiI (UPF0178 family)